MMRRLLFLLVLGFALANADEGTTHSLKVDLGEVVQTGLVNPVDGLSSAGQPDAAALRVFADSGYVAVIDMRTEGEDRGMDEPATVADLGMEYVAFPIDKGDISLDKAKELDELLAHFDKPVLLHCGSGNRVGALLALRDYLANGDSQKALRLGEDAGLTRLEGKVRDILADSEARQ